MITSNRQCPNCMVSLQLGLKSISETESICQEAWFCLRCKYQELGDFVEGTIHIEPLFMLVIEWQSETPTIAEIRAIRNIDSELKYRSISSVIATLKAKKYWEIEFYSKSNVEEAIQSCKEFNLKYRVSASKP